MDITKLITALSEAVSAGHLREASDIAKAELSKYAEVSGFGTLGVTARIDRGRPYTVLLDAHIDEVAFIVTAVFDDGFVKVSNAGGIDPRILPASRVIIHGKKDIPAVFTSTPPHLSKGEKEVIGIDDILLDTGLGSVAKQIVSAGDIATYDSRVSALAGGRLSGKSFDDRASVACLIELASRLCGKDIPCNVVISLTEQEELGTRGAVTSAFELHCDEAVALDVSFAAAPDVPAHQSGELGRGPMIGISPVLDRRITDRLIRTAEENGIPFQREVMGGRTGTDADAISVSRSGIPTGLISIPLRNMHTPAEVIDTADINRVCDLLEQYILGGGTHA